MTIKIFLGNLNSDTTSETLRPLFEKYGEVVECDVLTNFGFVHMNNKNEANKAIAQLDGYSVDGNNIRVELSTGKKGNGGGGGGGKFDRKGYGGRDGGRGGGSGPRGRPYGPPPPRDFRDYDRYSYPLPPMPFDRYDPYYRLYMEREALYSRMGPERSGRDRYNSLPLSRDRMADRYPAADPRDRLPARSFMEERARALPDAYMRDRDPIAARPPPEYYDRKPGMGGARGGGDALGGTGAGARGGAGGDFFRGGLDRAGGGLGGASAGGLGGSGNGPADYLGRQGQNGFGGRQNGPMGGGGGGRSGDTQSSFATDAIFF